jgi:hypothetical protein
MDWGVIKYHISDNSRFNEITPKIPWISDQTEEIIDIATESKKTLAAPGCRIVWFWRVDWG